jgi:hypothetical protein
MFGKDGSTRASSSSEPVGGPLLPSRLGFLIQLTEEDSVGGLLPHADFIVSLYSSSECLFIAFYGSFYGYKFLPMLGKYIIEILCGGLNPDLEKWWAWDRELPSMERNSTWPKRELRDLSLEG